MATSSQTPSGFEPASNVPLTVKVGELTVAPGSFVPVQKLQEPAISPALDFTNVSGSTAHALVMLDLDPPLADEDRKYAPLLHWLTPIPSGTKVLAAGDTTTKPIAAYVPPKPPAGSAPHRYVILVLRTPSENFELPEQFQGKTYEDLWSRVNFDLDGFIKAGGFEVAAASWFTSEPAKQ